MIRIRRSLVVSSVTAVTIRWQRGVVVVHMAIGAGHGGVRARERE
jgi:hypothetical protein